MSPLDPFELEPWRDAIAALRVLCPLSCKVSITRIRMPSGIFGDCDVKAADVLTVQLTDSSSLASMRSWFHCFDV